MKKRTKRIDNLVLRIAEETILQRQTLPRLYCLSLRVFDYSRFLHLFYIFYPTPNIITTYCTTIPRLALVSYRIRYIVWREISELPNMELEAVEDWERKRRCWSLTCLFSGQGTDDWERRRWCLRLSFRDKGRSVIIGIAGVGVGVRGSSWRNQHMLWKPATYRIWA